MGEEKRDWKAEAEEALQKTGDSLSAAWEATREGRMNALEKAKEAAAQLGAAIDRGVAAAKERWGAEQTGAPAPHDEPAADAEGTNEEE